MYDAGKVIVGILIFLALVTFPIWYNIASGKSDVPDPKIPSREDPCVADSMYMKTSHMDILNEWRDQVVRTGERRFHSETLDSTVEASLSNSCMKCHWNKSEFCDECHNYLRVDPYCWDCHIEPKEDR